VLVVAQVVDLARALGIRVRAVVAGAGRRGDEAEEPEERERS